MSDVVDLSRERTRRQLRRSLGLREPPPRLPPVPNAGRCKGDFVKLSGGEVGWISEQRWLASGRLLLCVRVKGRAVWVMASDVEPRSGA